MSKLTKEMEAMLAVELPIISTVNEDNTPNIGPKRSLRVYDENKLIYNENTGGRTLENLKKNPEVAVIVVDRPNLDGYRFVGKATVYTEGKYYDEACKWAEGKMGVPKAAVIIEITRIDSLKSGANAGKTVG